MAQKEQILQTKTVADFLVQVREHGTPLRVADKTETYYVLTATQLFQLLQLPLQDKGVAADELSFTLEEFGLTAADLTAYEAEQQRRQLALDTRKQRPLSTDLRRRLDNFRYAEASLSPTTQKEREQLLAELETVMAENLHALLTKSE
ncbi:MAG: hypothetical protein DYG89_39880 [Caldilinea sp. CFX5]|nr:hypothetical protein [Caldilinea sp. CFX5]